MDAVESARRTINAHDMVGLDAPVLLMVSGGSDSTALAYIAAELHEEGMLGPLAILHVNHKLRGDDADEDAAFVASLADLLQIELATVEVDVAAIAEAEGGNIEAIARRERYAVAHEVLSDMCRELGVPVSSGRIFVAHTADDRIENFYMRSIVGTGPGGFRSMLYLNGQVARPLLDIGREELRDYIIGRIERDRPVVRDAHEMLWREDATNQHTDRFRAFVRHEIIPLAKERNPQLVSTLTRTMNLIGDEDDMLDAFADDLIGRYVVPLEPVEDGYVLSPMLAAERTPMLRRVAVKVLESMLDPDDRIETASIDAILNAFEDGRPKSGYVANIQGNIAVSSNKQGVRIEPMAKFRTRRKRG
ncbi:MAG: tRNA lysidine(34) synthetase TilS [Eggerthellaceae bacterium]|nr:tRNA lysidine(34) synthetase TilS [Eggerthellaceae bacterium]